MRKYFVRSFFGLFLHLFYISMRVLRWSFGLIFSQHSFLCPILLSKLFFNDGGEKSYVYPTAEAILCGAEYTADSIFHSFLPDLSNTFPRFSRRLEISFRQCCIVRVSSNLCASIGSVILMLVSFRLF